MPKKIPPPNHQSVVWNSKYVRLVDDNHLAIELRKEVETLAEKYKFSCTYSMAVKIENAFHQEEIARKIQKYTPANDEQRILLVKLYKACANITDLIPKLGIHEYVRLSDFGSGNPVKLEQINDELLKLQCACKSVIGKIEKGTRDRNASVWAFVWHLADTWYELKKTTPTLRHNTVIDQFKGEFFEFTKDCATLGGIKLPQSPGSTIRNIVQEWRDKTIQ